MDLTSELRILEYINNQLDHIEFNNLRDYNVVIIALEALSKNGKLPNDIKTQLNSFPEIKAEFVDLEKLYEDPESYQLYLPQAGNKEKFQDIFKRALHQREEELKKLTEEEKISKIEETSQKKNLKQMRAEDLRTKEKIISKQNVNSTAKYNQQHIYQEGDTVESMEDFLRWGEFTPVIHYLITAPDSFNKKLFEQKWVNDLIGVEKDWRYDIIENASRGILELEYEEDNTPDNMRWFFVNKIVPDWKILGYLEQCPENFIMQLQNEADKWSDLSQNRHKIINYFVNEILQQKALYKALIDNETDWKPKNDEEEKLLLIYGDKIAIDNYLQSINFFFFLEFLQNC